MVSGAVVGLQLPLQPHDLILEQELAAFQAPYLEFVLQRRFDRPGDRLVEVTMLHLECRQLVEDGLAQWSGEDPARGRSLIVRGRANLLGDAGAVADLEQVRRLFNDLEQKEQLIGLLDDVRDAQGVRIFIGAETRLFSLSGSALIAAPYMSGRQKVLGAIGVIGPARLNYARVIPLVDYTARVLGRMLDG
jgi:heat-inducible transcriptional repressor